MFHLRQKGQVILSIFSHNKGSMVHSYCDKFGENISSSDRSVGSNTSQIIYAMSSPCYTFVVGLVGYIGTLLNNDRCPLNQ